MMKVVLNYFFIALNFYQPFIERLIITPWISI